MTLKLPHTSPARSSARLRAWHIALLTTALALAVAPSAQQAQNDPRVGLRGGLTDADEAAWNIERLANVPKPDAFTDRDNDGGLGFANTDIAFKGDLVLLGSYYGFNFYDIEDPRSPRLRLSVQCPGGQGDLSVYGNLLFMSVQETRSRLDCGTQGVEAPVSPERFRGVRIFDITDITAPQQVAAVQTCRGSHTHTVVTDPNDASHIFVYNSGTSGVRPAEELAGCSELEPDEDPNTSLFSIDVIEVPLAAPQNARIVSSPRIFADPATGAISGLWQGGVHTPGSQETRRTNQCHDITAYPEIGLAAGACSGNGILLDISDPANPVRIDEVIDTNFAYWHSATFNNDGSKVIFTDEWGGGTRPRCLDTDLPTWGANAVFDIVDGKMQFGGYFKMPAPQTEFENCVAHNGSLVPVPGRDIMVQAWYQGGLSVFDFTDSSNPVEIAFFDRGPVDDENLVTAGYWSTYWYNGHIYGSEIARGLDVFRLVPSDHLTQNELDAAALITQDTFNPQEQPRIEWPAASPVALAYVDQLVRANAIAPARASAVRDGLSRLDAGPAGEARTTVLDELDALSDQIATDADRSTGKNADRLRALSSTLAAQVAAAR